MIIIKIGTTTKIDWNNIALDLKKYTDKEQIIIVHGASTKRNEIAKRLGIKVKTIVSPSGVSSVFTNPELLEILLMAYPGIVNSQFVATLQRNGIDAVGLSGIDGQTWISKRKPKLVYRSNNKLKTVANNFSGSVYDSNTKLVKILLKSDFVPVICTPSISDQGEIINSDNDTAIAVMVKKLDIKKVFFLFEAPGLLKDVNDPKSLIKKVSANDLMLYMKYAQGRMKKKIIAAKQILQNGAQEVILSSVASNTPITDALNYQGTLIK